MPSVNLIIGLLMFLIVRDDVKGDWMHGFQVGRIPEGMYEYEKLNGLMKADEAVDICNLDPECAGFTYRGLLPGNNHGSPRKYKIFFFRYVQSVLVIPEFYSWVSYCSFKNFGRIIGVPGEESYNSSDIMKNLKDCTVSSTCAGLLIDEKENILQAYSYIDLDTIQRSWNQSNGIVLINLVTEPQLIGQSKLDFMKFNPCCAQKENTILRAPEHLEKVNDTLDRIDCNSISSAEFEEKYVLTRKAVMLVNCTSNWEAQKSWTIRGLLNRYPREEKKYWTTGYKEMHKPSSDEEIKLKWFDEEVFDKMVEEEEEEEMNEDGLDKSQMFGQDIIDLMDNANISFRVFEKVGLPFILRNIPEAKTDLYKDWTTPKPIPSDLYKNSIKLRTDYAWIIMGRAGSGTNLHQDPDLTDAWNSLLYGHKYWVLLPNDTPFSAYECEKSCSKNYEEFFSSAWYTEAVPQLRGKKWYGQRMIETIQGPGETIYVPHNMPHAVINLDENLSITENFMGIKAIDELAKYYALHWNPMNHYPPTWMERGWKNLLNALKKDDRIFLRDMYHQIKSNIPSSAQLS